MLQFIEVNDEINNFEKFNAAAKQAHEHPETHGLLVKIYADWCGHCQNMKSDWKRLIHELKKNYQCKKPGCVLTIANIRAVNLEPSDPVIQKLKYIPKDIHGVPLIAYINKGVRSLEYSDERIFPKMLKWVVSHPQFTLVHKNVDNSSKHNTLRSITKRANIKFKEIHRNTLRRFHKEMRRRHKHSVRSRMPTPFATRNNRQIPAYLRE